MNPISLPWGDILRSVPCVTVWHQKIKFYTVSAGEKSLKTYLVYVPMITKNCRGHLPDRSYLDTRIVHVTQWRFWENISKNISWTKKIHISTYKMHFRVVVAVNLKVLHFAIVISMSHSDFFSKWVFRFAQSQYQSEIQILILTMMTLSILNINKCL